VIVKIDEEWSTEDLDALLDDATARFDESVRCHAAGAPRAALVMLAGAFEALLLSAVVAYENELRTAALWPRRPSYQTLVELTRLTRQTGWLPVGVTDEIVEILNTARTMSAHPGAHVRGAQQAPGLELDDRVGYLVVYTIVVGAFWELAAALRQSTAAGPPQSADIRPGATSLL
jgi:hypothetical protein